MLCPVVLLNNLITKKTANAFDLGTHAKIDLFCIPPPKPPLNATSMEGTDNEFMRVGFWWVGVTDDESASNMAEGVRRHGGVAVPVLVNSRVIEPRTRLLRYKQSVMKLR